MNITQLIGKRCLIKIGSSSIYSRLDVTEYRVLEISPSGNWVKLQNLNGNKFWKPVAECSLVEELRELKPERPPNG